MSMLTKIDLEEMLTRATFPFEEMLYANDIVSRRLYVNEEISPETVEAIIRFILQYNADDKEAGLAPEDRKPVILYLSSHGGFVDAGYSLVDVIINSKTPVYTVNLGYQYSMGFLIGIAGHKRFCTPNAKFLMHDGEMYMQDSSSKMQDRMDFYRTIDAKTEEYVSALTKITPEKLAEMRRVEWYFFADEAKELGCTDYIIGVDCDIDEIV